MTPNTMEPMQLKSRTSIRFTPIVPGKPATPGVAPLVDIVFLLICFYLFVTQSFQSLDEKAVELPILQQSQSQELLPAEIVINLMPNATVRVAHEPISMRQLELKLRHFREQNPALRVVIRADRRQTFDKLNAIMTLCRKAGLESVILRAHDTQQTNLNTKKTSEIPDGLNEPGKTPGTSKASGGKASGGRASGVGASGVGTSGGGGG